jgi:4-hydroxy-L-threonine phosphate dehydrogenase PdxA
VKPKVAIATGDPAGIGPEISLKAARDPQVLELCQPVLFGDPAVLALHGSVQGVSVFAVKQEKPRLGTVAAEHGRAALAVAEAAIRAALAGDFDAVVGAPHTEAAIQAAGIEFDGYPSFVARTCGSPEHDAVLMLAFRAGEREMSIAHVTLHMSVAQAVQAITAQRVLQTIRAVHRYGARRIGISGVNPHAAGREESEILRPAIAAAQAEGMAVEGPFGADILFQRHHCDAYVVMLHDQGHVAAKVLAPQRIAALTLGTPVLFSSVGHGSALDIAGRGKANPDAMREAITRLVTRRRRGLAT